MFTATVLTKNSERTIGESLESLSWIPEIILLDTGSTDRTLEIARCFPNVKIHLSPFTGFGALHNQMAVLASHDWILSVDSDEKVSDELASELEELLLDPSCVYSITRWNFLFGKRVHHSGWSPDRVVRLYNRTRTSFSEVLVHEWVITEGLTALPLRHPIYHTPYLTIEDFLDKMQRYSSLFAKQNRHKRVGSLPRALLHGWGAFTKAYLIKGGLLDGFNGYLIASYNAHTAFYKYLKLRELNCKEVR